MTAKGPISYFWWFWWASICFVIIDMYQCIVPDYTVKRQVKSFAKIGLIRVFNGW